jgi:hypothetical protein
VLCVLSVGGLAQAQSVEHVGHHAHHQAVTHASPFCSWMCAAGQGLEGIAVAFGADYSLLGFIWLTPSSEPPIADRAVVASRGPPVVSL